MEAALDVLPMASAMRSGLEPDAETRLREAVAKVRQEQPGLVAKQVHAVLLEEEQWAHTTVSEVKRACSKLAKAEITESHANHMAAALDGPDHHSRSSADLVRDLLMDPKTRDAYEFKLARPGLPTNGTTLMRGDRLGTAAERGDTQQVKKLLKKGVDPNFQNAVSGVTPLGVACERGHTGVVKALLEANASPEVATAEGYRPAHIAAQFGQAEIVEILVAHKADVHARCPLQDTFPLLLATNFNFLDVMRVLLDAKADPDFASESRGLTSLHYCCSLESVDMLIAAGASVDHRANIDCMTPLHSVVQAGCPKACLGLLAAKADPAIKDGMGLKPAELAIDVGGPAKA